MGDSVAASIMTKGLRLFFHTDPPLSLDPHPSARICPKQEALLWPIVKGWWEEGRVKEILTKTPMFYSRMFSVPKKSGDLRPIIDLSYLNRMLIIPRFKMETIQRIVRTIQSELWVAQ